jgi:hypothetical protein
MTKYVMMSWTITGVARLDAMSAYLIRPVMRRYQTFLARNFCVPET